MSPDVPERRRSPRIAHPFLIRYRSSGSEGTWRIAPVRNLSAHGACFRGEYDFQIGEEVVLQLILPSSKQPLSLTARVVWSKRVNEPLHLIEYGVEFHHPDPSTQRLISELVAGFLHQPSG